MDRDPPRGAGRARRRGEVGAPGADPDREPRGCWPPRGTGGGCCGSSRPTAPGCSRRAPGGSTASCASAAPWDGRWLVLSVPIPETQRRLRHRLRTRLTWLGLGVADLRAVGHARRHEGRRGARASSGPRARGPGVRLGGSGQPASATRAGCWPRRGTSPTSRTATWRSWTTFEGRAPRAARGVRGPGRDGAGVAPVPLPRPRPARASCSTTTGPDRAPRRAFHDRHARWHGGPRPSGTAWTAPPAQALTRQVQ